VTKHAARSGVPFSLLCSTLQCKRHCTSCRWGQWLCTRPPPQLQALGLLRSPPAHPPQPCARPKWTHLLCAGPHALVPPSLPAGEGETMEIGSGPRGAVLTDGGARLASGLVSGCVLTSSSGDEAGRPAGSPGPNSMRPQAASRSDTRRSTPTSPTMQRLTCTGRRETPKNSHSSRFESILEDGLEKPHIANYAAPDLHGEKKMPKNSQSWPLSV